VPADEISATLSVARSNVSTSLRELQGWGIVRVVHVLGDRRDHFESTKDVWEIFRTVSEERKRREIDPTLRVLTECVQELKIAPAGDAYTRERLESMLDFLTIMSGLFEEILRMPMGALKGVGKFARQGHHAPRQREKESRLMRNSSGRPSKAGALAGRQIKNAARKVNRREKAHHDFAGRRIHRRKRTPRQRLALL